MDRIHIRPASAALFAVGMLGIALAAPASPRNNTY